MALSDTDVKAKYNANGSNDTFAIPFDYVATSEVKVYTADETTTPVTETLKTLTTHYTISGGNIVFVTAPADGLKVVVIRVNPLTQTADYIEDGPFAATTHESALDKIVRLVQELNEKVLRAPVARLTTAVRTSPYTLPDPVAGDAIGWNSAATDLENIELPTDANIRAATSSAISAGETSVSVTFSSAMSAATYGLTLCWVNTTDGSPMFQPIVVTTKSTTGFTAKWNTALDTANYSLSYIAMRVG